MHTLAPPFTSSIYFAHSHQRCSALAQSVAALQTLGNEVPMLYTSLIYLHKTFTFETRSVCAYAARTQAHFNFLTSLQYYHFMPMHGVQKRGAWGRRHKLFFRFFLLKNAYFCTFLIYIAYFCGAATVGSALRALFDCFLVIFMLKYQGGHGV